MTGYTKVYNKSSGNTIEASDFNTEFQAIDDAMNASTGHKHDGTTDEGAFIPMIYDAAGKDGIEIDATNHELDFNINVSGVKTRQVYLADGALVPNTDSDVDLGTTSLRFKDGYIDSLTVTTSATVAGSALLGAGAIGVTVQGYDADTTKNDVANTFTAVQTFPNTGLHILDTNATHDLIIAPGSNLTADRTLTLTTGDADRTIDVSAGSVTFGAYANTLNNVADEAGFKAAVNLEIGTDVQAYDSNLTTFVGAFTLPTSDGSTAQVLSTNGSGVLSFVTQSAALNVQEFSSTDTWNKPSTGSMAYIECWGAGGGGGSGRLGEAGSDRYGGKGGAGGGYSFRVVPLSSLASTEAVTIGAGGTGGAAVSGTAANGNAGSAGGDTTFSTFVSAAGGNGGTGGTASSSTGTTTPGGVSVYVGGTGSGTGGSAVLSGLNGGTSPHSGGGGACGGALASSNSASGANIGGNGFIVTGTTGICKGGNGGLATDNGATVAAGAAGAGFASGGGGGSAGQDGSAPDASGAGGDGADGYCRVTVF